MIVVVYIEEVEVVVVVLKGRCPPLLPPPVSDLEAPGGEEDRPSEQSRASRAIKKSLSGT